MLFVTICPTNCHPYYFLDLGLAHTLHRNSCQCFIFLNRPIHKQTHESNYSYNTLIKTCNDKTKGKVGLGETAIPLVRPVTIGHFKLPTSLFSTKIKDFIIKHKSFIHNRNNLTKLYIFQYHIKIEEYLYFKIF